MNYDTATDWDEGTTVTPSTKKPKNPINYNTDQGVFSENQVKSLNRKLEEFGVEVKHKSDQYGQDTVQQYDNFSDEMIIAIKNVFIDVVNKVVSGELVSVNQAITQLNTDLSALEIEFIQYQAEVNDKFNSIPNLDELQGIITTLDQLTLDVANINAELDNKKNGITLLNQSVAPISPTNQLYQYNNELYFAGKTIDKNFTFDQAVPAITWNVAHNLNKRVNVTVVDSSGRTVVGGCVTYVDNNNIQIEFGAAFSGKAYLN